MSFIYRLAYYLIGFTFGMFILMFVFSGKKTSCNYFPSKRVKNDLLKKNLIIPDHLKDKHLFINDSLIYTQISSSKVIFSKSNFKNKDSCKIYRLETEDSIKKYVMDIKNCPSFAMLNNYYFK